MRFSLRFSLLAAFLTLIVFLVGAQTLVLNRGLRPELHSIQEREVARELALASVFLQSLGPVGPDSAARVLAGRIGYPVTLLDQNGVVVGASSSLPFQRKGLRVPPESPELLLTRRGDVAFSRRRAPDEVEIRLFATTRSGLEGTDYLLQVAVPLGEIDRVVRSRIWRSLALLVPAFGLALVFSLLLGRAFVHPIRKIARHARALAAGDLSRRIPRPIRSREVDELADTFNRLSEELLARYRFLESERDEMQRLIDCMGEAVLALTQDGRVLRTNRAARELLDFPDPTPFAPVGALVRQPALRDLLEGSISHPFSAREATLGDRQLIVSARAAFGGGAVVTFLDVTKIRRLEMVRRDFVANASHELKTPLTAMRGFAETLLEDDPPEELRRGFLASIRVNTLRLQNLVDDLLDLSRLESGGWLAKKEEVEMASLVKDLLEGFRDRSSEKSLTLSLEGDALVLADEQGLIQVMQNLIENAVQYTSEGGSIGVEILEEGAQVRVEVRDTGIGIPTSALPRIFERFFRVDPARSRAGGGTGLGLAIVRHLVEAMGGKVWAESELGQGTSVFFTLQRVPDEGV